MATNNVTVNIDAKELHEVIEKANHLVELLKEAKQIIDSLSNESLDSTSTDEEFITAISKSLEAAIGLSTGDTDEKEAEPREIDRERLEELLDNPCIDTESSRDDYALIADVILLLANQKNMSTIRAHDILKDAKEILPCISKL